MSLCRQPVQWELISIPRLSKGDCVGTQVHVFPGSLRAIVLALRANAEEFQGVEQHLESRLLFAGD